MPELTTHTDDERRAAGVARNGLTPCAVDGCDRSPATGDALHRVNPKGELGIFMCTTHARAVG